LIGSPLQGGILDTRHQLRLAALSLALFCPSAVGQPAAPSPPDGVRIHSAPYHPPSDIISVETNLVELAVTVRDRKEIGIPGLQASDFQLYDNSKLQKITFFSEEDALPPSPGTSVSAGARTSALDSPPPTSASSVHPRFIALFFDNTHAGPAGFEYSRQAARKLINESLQPGDRIGIYTSAGDVEQDFTSDVKALLAALDKIHRHPSPGVANGINKCPTLTVYQSYMIITGLDPAAKALAAREMVRCHQ
jgi:VWFA-related protein